MGNERPMKTYMAKPNEVTPRWYQIDATDKVLGRLASKIAVILMGKNKPTYTPHVDTGDFVVVLNAEKVTVTGRKMDVSVHKSYSGYPGGLNQKTFREVMDRHPERIVTEAVRRMLPKNKLATKMLKKLKVVIGPDNPYTAQKCEVID